MEEGTYNDFVLLTNISLIKPQVEHYSLKVTSATYYLCFSILKVALKFTWAYVLWNFETDIFIHSDLLT